MENLTLQNEQYYTLAGGKLVASGEITGLYQVVGTIGEGTIVQDPEDCSIYIVLGK